MKDSDYEKWLSERRGVVAPSNLPDRVMQAVTDRGAVSPVPLMLRLAWAVETSRIARFMAYGAALAVGMIPFLFVAHAARLLVF